jgi:hypothetical protein
LRDYNLWKYSRWSRPEWSSFELEQNNDNKSPLGKPMTFCSTLYTTIFYYRKDKYGCHWNWNKFYYLLTIRNVTYWDIKTQVAAKRVKDSLDKPTKSLKKINKSIQYNSRENGIIYRKACEIWSVHKRDIITFSCCCLSCLRENWNTKKG